MEDLGTSRLVRAGSDWRSLNDLNVVNGYLRDLAIVPAYRSGYMGVHGWDDTMGTVAGRSSPTNGAFSVADPRYQQSAHWNHGQQFGVVNWAESAPTITGQKSPGQDKFAVADPRGESFGKYPVTDWQGHAGTVIAASTTGQGAFAVADPGPVASATTTCTGSSAWTATPVPSPVASLPAQAARQWLILVTTTGTQGRPHGSSTWCPGIVPAAR